MRQQFLLLQDVEEVGRSGEIISAKPGFARNYLIPQKKAVPATDHTLRMQARLQTERLKQAESDRKEAQTLADKIEGLELSTIVRVDPEGNLYGSVGASDILALFEAQGFSLERRNIGSHVHLKTLGKHTLTLKLKEGVMCQYSVFIEADHSAQ